jgi:hypothetical protein
MEVSSKQRWIVHAGLCAAFAVLALSLGILIAQGLHADSSAFHDLVPAQIQPNPSVNHAPAGPQASSDNHAPAV